MRPHTKKFVSVAACVVVVAPKCAYASTYWATLLSIPVGCVEDDISIVTLPVFVAVFAEGPQQKRPTVFSVVAVPACVQVISASKKNVPVCDTVVPNGENNPVAHSRTPCTFTVELQYSANRIDWVVAPFSRVPPPCTSSDLPAAPEGEKKYAGSWNGCWVALPVAGVRIFVDAVDTVPVIATPVAGIAYSSSACVPVRKLNSHLLPHDRHAVPVFN